MTIDPLLGDFDMPVLIDFPIATGSVPGLNAVLVTRSDNDHYSVRTCGQLAPATNAFHSTQYVDTLVRAAGLPSSGHDIGDRFTVNQITVEVTPADHARQNDTPGAADRIFQTGRLLRILDPDPRRHRLGARRLPTHLPQNLDLPTPDAMLFDFSDSEWHFGLDGAVSMANAYPDTQLLLHHWGCVDAPDFAPFNADPSLLDRIVNPDRNILLAPGQPYTLHQLTN